MAEEPVKPAEVTPEPVPTLDRVLDELNKPEESAPAAPAVAPAAEPAKPGAEPVKPAEVKPGEPAKPADAKPAEAAGPFKVGEEAKFKISDIAVKTREEIEKLPYANDASFKGIMGEFEALAQFKVGMSQALNEVQSIGKYTIPDAETMKAVVADAYMLYDIINLKESPAALFDLAMKNFGEESIQQVIAGILLYAKEKGITEEMYSDLTKPENKKIFELSRESRERRQKEERDRTVATERENTEAVKKVLDTTAAHVETKLKELGVSEEDVEDYTTILLAKIDGDTKVIDQVRAGKFGEVDRILTEYHNKVVERQSRWEKSLTERKTNREKKLGGAPPAGGGTPPAEPKPKKVNINDDDERLNAVTDMIRNG